MGSGGVAIAALPTVICLKVPFSDGLGGVKILLCNSLPNIYLTLNILTSIIWIVVLFNIVSIKGNCAEQRLFENNGYVNRGKLAFAYHFSLSKIYRHQVCLGYSQQPLGRNSTSQINTMRSTICKYLCLLPSKVASCHR